ncbi:MAG: DUF7689 domain-containing protein [Pyrinomonadaceae bacterium]
MRDPELETKFPKLRSGGYSIASSKDKKYNAIAFAVGNPTRNWNWMPYPTGGYYWPPGITGDDTINTWARVFMVHGYSLCDNGDFENGVEKVVLYCDPDGTPTHVAKQDVTIKKWISKLGKDYDIQHDSFDVLEGYDEHEYGTAVRFMARPTSTRGALE